MFMQDIEPTGISEMHNLTIDRIETWSCTVPLDHPIDFGSFTVEHRHHCLLRISTSDGLRSDVIGQSRGAPIDVALNDLLAPLLIGLSAARSLEIRNAVASTLTTLDREGVINRAWSLMEIGLHDLQAQAANLPLWALLGGEARPLPVQIVEGYALNNESARSFVDRLTSRAEEGYRLIKVAAAHYKSPIELLDRVAAFHTQVGDNAQLVLDFAWSWKNARDHQFLLDGLRHHNIAWIEDCFERTRINRYHELRRSTPIPIGCGDEASRLSDLIALVEARAVDVIRADATTLGGIGAVHELSLVALREGIRLSCHEHPETHEHIAFGLGCTDHIEMFTSDRPFDCAHKLLESVPETRVRRGMLHPPELPGTGVRFIDKQVSKYATRHNITELSKASIATSRTM
jgi:L-alanine-DL-glutamate epimerase-like enolase superfamily enzyme